MSMTFDIFKDVLKEHYGSLNKNILIDLIKDIIKNNSFLKLKLWDNSNDFVILRSDELRKYVV